MFVVVSKIFVRIMLFKVVLCHFICFIQISTPNLKVKVADLPVVRCAVGQESRFGKILNLTICLLSIPL